MKKQADLVVLRAERNAITARERFFATFAEIRHRSDPRVIAAEAAETLVGRANLMLSETTMSVKSRPMLALGGLAAFFTAVGCRYWLAKSKRDSDAT